MKTFLSIGTGPGIGIATAERFSAEGFNTVLCSRNPENLEMNAHRLRQEGRTCETMKVDAADPGSIQSLIAIVIQRHAAIDVLHYNAASLRLSTIADQPTNTFLSDLSVNIAGAMVAIQAASPSMFTRGQGTILLTGGRLGVGPVPEYISLSIGKAGIRTLALGLFEVFKSEGVHVGTVTVSATTDAGAAWSAGVAEAFWKLHNTHRDAWMPEAVYP